MPIAGTDVYIIRHKSSGKRYIGAGHGAARVRRHFSNSSNEVLRRAINKYGRDAFDVQIISCGTTRKAALLEKKLVQKYGGPDDPGLYNFIEGGGSKARWSKESKDKQRRAQNKRWAKPGIRAKHGKASKSALASPEVRARISEGTRRGLTKPGMSKKLSARTKAGWDDAKVRRRRTEGLRKKWRSPEMRAEQSARSRAAWDRPGERARRGKALSRAWARPGAKEAHSRRLKRSHARAEVREAKSKATKKQWENPVTRRRRVAGITAALNAPGMHEKLSTAIRTGWESSPYKIPRCEYVRWAKLRQEGLSVKQALNKMGRSSFVGTFGRAINAGLHVPKKYRGWMRRPMREQCAANDKRRAQARKKQS